MKHSLVSGELRYRREYATCIAGQENDIGWVVVGDAGDLGVLDVLDRVCATSIFGQGRVIIVNDSSFWAEDDVLENGAEPYCVEDIRLLISG